MKFKVAVRLTENGKVVYEDDKARFADGSDATEYAEMLGAKYASLNLDGTVSIIVYKSNKFYDIFSV